MSSIPSNLVRVPNGLASRVMLGSITRSQADLLRLQVQLSSQSRINKPSDDPIGTSALSVVEDLLERRDQTLRNLSHAEAVLNNTDAALGEVGNIVIEAKGIASSQIGVGSDAQTRENQAQVIDAMLSELLHIANRKYQQIHLFGGEMTGHEPFVSSGSGIRYEGSGDGFRTDLGLSRGVPITVSGADAFGAVSSRVEGTVDLDPQMVAGTLLTDLRGARGLGISLGSVAVDVDGTDLTVDLSEAHTVGDVADLLTEAIQTVDPTASVSIDSASGNRFAVDVGASTTITIADLAVPSTAADLGIAQAFTAGSETGTDLDPILRDKTALADLAGITLPLGSIRLQNLGQTRDVDLSGAVTIQDVRNLIEGADIGIRVELAETGDSINFINGLSGGAMSIGEVGGGTTATDLGIRSLTGSTRLEDFNDGRGVSIRSGSVDPITGLPDPTEDLDFTVELKDGGSFDVDLAGAETVGDVLDLINAAAAAAGYVVGTDFEAGLAAEGNGIALTDATNGGVGTTSVTMLNASFAAEDLGIKGSTTGATLTGEDRATVAVDSLFAHLMALRDALRGNDERGITFAAERLEDDLSRATQVRAEVGVRTRRVVDAVEREEELRIQDMGLKSQIKDLDFTDAAIRFSLLQQQLQAGLTSASRAVQLSLLDFLG